MGSASSVDCCQPQEGQNELSSIVPSKIHAVAVLEENYLFIKEAVSATSFLSEVDFYITMFKQNAVYRKQFLRLFSNFQDLLDMINFELTPQWMTPIQSKTFDLGLIRFNFLSKVAFPIQFGLIDLSLGSIQSIFVRGNLKKTINLLLDKDFKAYKEEQYLKWMMNSLREWQELQDFVWVLDAQATFADMRRHILYHWSRCVGLVNSNLSINDALSWHRARFLYNFALHILVSDPLPILQDSYFIDNWVYEAEGALLAPGQSITFFGFVQLSPYVEEKSDYEEDAVRFNPPKGDEDIPKVKLKFIVTPLKEAATKFRTNELLFYLPLTTFMITGMESRYGQIFVFLREQQSQVLTKYLSDKTREKAIQSKPNKQAERTIIDELTILRESTAQQIQKQQSKGRIEQCCLDYYKKYVKGRVIRLNDSEIPTLSKKQLQICEDEVKVALEEQMTREEAESDIRQVIITPQETLVLERELQRYIKRLQFEKLQSQIDDADIFINITSLNISQCWLQKLQCLHCFPNLTQLFAYSNMIKKIEGLDRNQNLRLLSLARNQIEVLENMDHLVHLRELYLTKNRLEMKSAVYLSTLNLSKLKMLTISFKQHADECFDALLHRPPPRLKQLVINEGDQLSHRTKSMLRRRLKGVTIQYIHD